MAVKKHQEQTGQAVESGCQEIERYIGKYKVKLCFAEQEVPEMPKTLLTMVMQAYAERQEQFFR